MLPNPRAGKFFFIIGMMYMLAASSCLNAQYLTTERAYEPDIKGKFTIIFYGYNYADDLETAVFFDIEGDGFTFEPYARDYDFQIAKGIDASLGLKEAKWFVSRHTSFISSRMRKILDPNGTVIGYEMRPIYHITTYGRSDMIDIYYRIADAKIIITVDIKDFYKKRKFRSDSVND
jgi:hypothetical protein